jgi:hypothetical protein
MDITGAILLIGIGAVIGFLVGALVFALRRSSYLEQSSGELLLSDTEHSIRIWREGKERRLVVEINGVSHTQESDLNSDQSRILAGLIKELQAWMEVLPAPVAQSQPEAAKLPTSTIGEEVQSTSLNPLKIFTRSLQPMEKSGIEGPDLSIVAQIDEILQAKLVGTHLADQGIHLVEGADQGMVIQVGLNSYTEIEAVPDKQMRQLIRISVAEWENSLGD